MAKEPAAQIQLLRSQKATLIEILSGEADFVLQHADSRCLLSDHGYQQVKSCHVPSEKVTELLDHVIQRGPEAAQGLLDLLKDQALQETFPRLSYIKDLQVDKMSSEARKKNKDKGRAQKRKRTPELQEATPCKQIKGCHLVTEKQLMTVARGIGRCWREIGRLALDIRSVKLEQIEEDHSLLVERVFAMLRYWRMRQREAATAARLHSLLCQGDWALPSESIDFLLETD